MDDPLYDDRPTRMLRAIRNDSPLDIRGLVVQTGSTDAWHESNDRPSSQDLEAIYRVDEKLAEPAPSFVMVADDILTTGAHFRVMKSVLTVRFPGTKVAGLFLARRALDSADLEDFDDFAF